MEQSRQLIEVNDVNGGSNRELSSGRGDHRLRMTFDRYKKYKFYRDQINHLIRKSKKDYYITYFENFKKNSKKLWSGVKEIINKNVNDKSPILNLQVNGKIVSDNKTIANSFNKYFTTIAQKLQEKMKPSSVHFSNYMHINYPDSIFLDPVTPEEVNDIIANLDETKANDSYDIPPKLIKLVRHTLSKPFSIIANSSFSEVSKSNFLIVRPHKNNRTINLKINDENLKQEAFSKYLGVLIDEKLNWKQHINQLNTKISKSIGILYKLRYLVPKSTLVTLYNSFIQSHVLYGLLNWGCANKTTLESLKINLRKAVRVIDFASYTAHSEPIFKRFKLLNLDNLYKLETAKFMFHINQENSGNFLQKEFMKTSKLHCYNTRQSSDLGFSLPSISTNFKRNFLTFDGVKIWNSLPLEIKSTRNKNPFKKMMKKYLLQSS